MMLAASIALVVGQLAIIIPHPVSFNGSDVGDAGIALAQMVLHFQDKPVYGLVADHDLSPIVGYPFTASVLTSPFLLAPLDWFAPLFSALSAFLLAFVILEKYEPWRLMVFLSFPYLSSIHSNQWTPLLLAAFYLPALFPIVLAKPQLALLPLTQWRWSWRAVGVMLAIGVVSLILYPTWLVDYVTHLFHTEYEGWIPALTGPGFVLWGALWFWKKEPARQFLAVSLTPQRLWYDQLLVFGLAHNWKEAIYLTAASWVAMLISRGAGWIEAFGPQDWRAVYLVIVLLYLPFLGKLVWQERVSKTLR